MEIACQKYQTITKLVFDQNFKICLKQFFWLVWASGKAKIVFEAMNLEISGGRVDVEGSQAPETVVRPKSVLRP